jgi:hypothetical protein
MEEELEVSFQQWSLKILRNMLLSMLLAKITPSHNIQEKMELLQ